MTIPASTLPRPTADFSLRLPQGWRQNIREGDRKWIGHNLFVAKGKLTPHLKLWWYPPALEAPTAQPSPEQYHHKRLFLWMSHKMWLVNFQCSHCITPQSLHSKGLYKNVLDLKDFYYLAGEYMECSACGGTFISWDNHMLDQLTTDVWFRFPAVLTQKYACDMAVMTLLRDRTLGNSPTTLCHNLQEVHSKEWVRQQLSYLGDCERDKYHSNSLGVVAINYIMTHCP